MSNRAKGIVLAIATTLVPMVVCPISGDLVAWLFFLAIITIPYGAFLGGLAGRLEADRFLVLAAVALAITPFLAIGAMALNHPPLDRVVACLIGAMAIPILVAVAILERWTRNAAPIPPAAPRRRPLSVVEIGVGLSIAAVAAIALIAHRLPPHVEEYSFWYKTASPIDVTSAGQIFLFFVGPATTTGVVLAKTTGWLARAGVAAAGVLILGGAAAVSTPLEWHAIYALPIALVVVGLSLKSNADSCRARPSRSDL